MPATANTIPAQQPYGYAISWGLGQTTITVGGVSGYLGQTADVEMGVEKWEGRDQRGTVVSRNSYNPMDTYTFEYVVIASGSYDSITASITYPTQGSMISVNADATNPLSGSNWIIDKATVRESNTDAVKVNLACTRYLGITQ